MASLGPTNCSASTAPTTKFCGARRSVLPERIDRHKPGPVPGRHQADRRREVDRREVDLREVDLREVDLQVGRPEVGPEAEAAAWAGEALGLDLLWTPGQCCWP